ncbi:MAG: ABC transporter substrate-binding protein [Ferruginibacter sp.]
MKKIFILSLISFFLNKPAHAQDTLNVPLKTYNIGIFAPLFLDSVFTAGNYKYNKSFPKFILPGLEFVQGAQIALDSMQVYQSNIDASFYDTKSTSQSLPFLINAKKLDSLDLIIGSVRDSDYVQLANFALQKNIPFISATFPNDAGITANPFVVIVNSTLKAHCEAIYSYILQNHGADKIFLVRKHGSQEDRIASYFKSINEPDGKPLLNIQTININDNFLMLENKIDTSKQTVIIGGSLDEKFALKIASVAYTYNRTSPVKLIGMPNWEGMVTGKKAIFQDFPIYFTSPYYNVKWDTYSRMMKDVYLKKYKGNPSDMSYKGFEIVYLFTRLLAKHPNDFMSQLNNNNGKVFSEYNFKPVFLSRQSVSPDYFENKHLYFIRALNGSISKAW